MLVISSHCFGHPWSLLSLAPYPAGGLHTCVLGVDVQQAHVGVPVQPRSQQDHCSRLSWQPLLGQSFGLKTTQASWERVLRPLKRGWCPVFLIPGTIAAPPPPPPPIPTFAPSHNYLIGCLLLTCADPRLVISWVDISGGRGPQQPGEQGMAAPGTLQKLWLRNWAMKGM